MAFDTTLGGLLPEDAFEDEPVYGGPKQKLAPKPAAPEVDPYQQQFAKSQAGVLGSAAGQLSAAQQAAKYAMGGPEAVEKRQQAALGGLRARSGQAFAGQMAQGGGGSMAGMRQSQLSRGVAEGQLMSNFDMQKIAAQRLAAQTQKEAAQAAGEYATTEQKLKQAEADRAKTQIEEVDTIEKTLKEDFDKAVARAPYYWGDKDREQFAAKIGEKYKNHPNPAVRAMVKKAQEDILADTGDYEA